MSGELCTKCKKEVSKKSRGWGTSTWCATCSNEYERTRWNKLSQEQQRERWLKTKYGLTWQEYEALYKQQGGCCATCGTKIDILKKDGTKDVACVDHCHTTGLVRGLLCNHCNRALGLVHDRRETLLKMVEYLDASCRH